MGEVSCTLTVFFEEPFWIGVFERIENGRLTAAKVTFGAEPKDYEVWDYILKNYGRLRFSPAVSCEIRKKAVNPKRLQRQLSAGLQDTGIGTRSQLALKMQQEQMKTERKVRSREQKLADEQRRFELKQLKKKDRHRGH